MAGSWDGNLKRLVQEAPQDFVDWLLSGALFEDELSPHLQHRQVDADLLYRLSFGNHPLLLHLEFQRRSDPQMARRLWEYDVLATCKFDCPVYSFVLYLKKDGPVAQSPHQVCLHDGRMVHHFHFGVIKLWDVPSASLLDAGLPGLLPLLPLSREGKRRETIDAMIKGLCPPGEAPNGGLLSLAYGLASLVFEEREEHGWLQRRFLMMEELLAESWVFREWREKALEEGLKQGLQQGEEKGRKEGREEGQEEALLREIQRQRQILLAFVQARFPSLTQLAEERCKAFDNPEQLQTLILNVGLAQREQDVRKCLFDDK